MGVLRRMGSRTPRILGVVTVLALVGALVGVYQVDRVSSFLSSLSADSVTAEFDGVRGNKLSVGSDVKVADIVVGSVDAVEQTGEGSTVTTLRLDDYDAERLGFRPRAQIRATTLLGGKYYVELQPGDRGEGHDGQNISLKDTEVPVELDEVLRAVPPPAQDGLRATSRQLDDALRQGGKQALQRTFDEAPGTLRPAGSVLTALQGKRPGGDLTTLVSATDDIARTLTEKDGQLGSVVDSLSGVSSAVASQSESLSEVTADLPENLASTNSGLRSLQGTLGRLVTTARDVRPAVSELGPLVSRVDSLAQRARPVVRELVPVLRQARPLVDDLVPTAGQATRTLDNLSGPVLDRVRGPIVNRVTSDWHGTGKFAGNGNDHKLYEEVGYLASRGANLSHYTDRNSQLIALALGVGADAVGGIDPLGLGGITSNLLGKSTVPPPAQQPTTGRGQGQDRGQGGNVADDEQRSLLPLPNTDTTLSLLPQSPGRR